MALYALLNKDQIKDKIDQHCKAKLKGKTCPKAKMALTPCWGCRENEDLARELAGVN